MLPLLLHVVLLLLVGDLPAYCSGENGGSEAETGGQTGIMELPYPQKSDDV
jgi:hypothetical protein